MKNHVQPADEVIRAGCAAVKVSDGVHSVLGSYKGFCSRQKSLKLFTAMKNSRIMMTQ
jgi:hypothetical protein